MKPSERNEKIQQLLTRMYGLAMEQSTFNTPCEEKLERIVAAKEPSYREVLLCIVAHMLIDPELETSLDKGTQRRTTENELPSLTQCTA